MFVPSEMFKPPVVCSNVEDKTLIEKIREARKANQVNTHTDLKALLAKVSPSMLTGSGQP